MSGGYYLPRATKKIMDQMKREDDYVKEVLQEHAKKKLKDQMKIAWENPESNLSMRILGKAAMAKAKGLGKQYINPKTAKPYKYVYKAMDKVQNNPNKMTIAQAMKALNLKKKPEIRRRVTLTAVEKPKRRRRVTLTKVELPKKRATRTRKTKYVYVGIPPPPPSYKAPPIPDAPPPPIPDVPAPVVPSTIPDVPALAVPSTSSSEVGKDPILTPLQVGSYMSEALKQSGYLHIPKKLLWMMYQKVKGAVGIPTESNIVKVMGSDEFVTLMKQQIKNLYDATGFDARGEKAPTGSQSKKISAYYKS